MGWFGGGGNLPKKIKKIKFVMRFLFDSAPHHVGGVYDNIPVTRGVLCVVTFGVEAL